MAEEGFKRKLTAILSADAVDYSRLMGEDEEATVRTLKSYREVFATLIQQHNGQVLDSPGDNLLAEFVSVVDAVQCAVSVQKEIKARNDDLPENRRMHFRIGINLGDVIQEEGRIYGDGVNIAARLEGLAEPGGICISKTAFDHIESKLPYGYDFLGDQTVKNISKPVGAYRVLLDPRVTASGKPIDKKHFFFNRRSMIVGIAAILVVVIAAGIWQFYNSRVSKEPVTVGEKPSIAVLPFDNMSGDPEQDYISDGISESIISALSKLPYLTVISRNSTFVYKDKQVKITQIGQELGARYILEGSVFKSGEKVRINAQFIDALKDHHVWSETYDRQWTDFLSILDEITLAVLKSLTLEVTSYPDSAVKTDSLEAWLLSNEAGTLAGRGSREDIARAIKLAKKSIEIDPNWSILYSMLADCLITNLRHGWTKSPEETKQQVGEMILKALEIDESNSYAHQVLGEMHLTQKKYDDALVEYKKAVDLDPNSAFALWGLSRVFLFMGKPEEALPVVKESMRLNPHFQWYFPSVSGKIYFHTGRYEEALTEFEKVLEACRRDECWMYFPHVYLAMLYGKFDREKEAQYHMEKVLEYNPKFNLESRRKVSLFKNIEYTDREIEGLRKAGAPEHPPSQ
jgi:adenylate cyclase